MASPQPRGSLLEIRGKLPIFAVTMDVYPEICAKICAALQKNVHEKGEPVFVVWDLAAGVTSEYLLDALAKPDKMCFIWRQWNLGLRV